MTWKPGAAFFQVRFPTRGPRDIVARSRARHCSAIGLMNGSYGDGISHLDRFSSGDRDLHSFQTSCGNGSRGRACGRESPANSSLSHRDIRDLTDPEARSARTARGPVTTCSTGSRTPGCSASTRSRRGRASARCSTASRATASGSSSSRTPAGSPATSSPRSSASSRWWRGASGCSRPAATTSRSPTTRSRWPCGRSRDVRSAGEGATGREAEGREGATSRGDRPQGRGPEVPRRAATRGGRAGATAETEAIEGRADDAAGARRGAGAARAFERARETVRAELHQEHAQADVRATPYTATRLLSWVACGDDGPIPRTIITSTVRSRANRALNWPPFRPDTRHSSEGLGISSSTCLCRTTISGLN
jgi:hypothetical protein